jgi:hypothetical protein
VTPRKNPKSELGWLASHFGRTIGLIRRNLSGLAILALAGAGFAVGSVVAPDHAGSKTPTTVTAAALRPVVNAPDNAGRPPALARVQPRHKHKKPAKKSAADTISTEVAGVSGTVAQQSQPQGSSGTSGSSTNTQTKTRTETKQPSGDTTTTLQPPPFDEHTSSGQ